MHHGVASQRVITFMCLSSTVLAAFVNKADPERLEGCFSAAQCLAARGVHATSH